MSFRQKLPPQNLNPLLQSNKELLSFRESIETPQESTEIDTEVNVTISTQLQSGLIYRNKGLRTPGDGPRSRSPLNLFQNPRRETFSGQRGGSSIIPGDKRSDTDGNVLEEKAIFMNLGQTRNQPPPNLVNKGCSGFVQQSNQQGNFSNYSSINKENREEERAEISNLQDEFQKTRKALTILQEEKAALIEHVGEKDNAIRRLNDELQNATSHKQTSCSQREVDKLRMENRNLDEMLREYKGKLDKERTVRSDEVKSLFDQMSKMRLELREVKDRNNELVSANQSLREETIMIRNMMDNRVKEFHFGSQEKMSAVFQEFRRRLLATINPEVLEIITFRASPLSSSRFQSEYQNEESEELIQIVEKLGKYADEKHAAFVHAQARLEMISKDDRKKEQIKSLKQELQCLMREKAELLEQVNEFEKEKVNNLNDFEGLREELKSLDQENAKLKDDLLRLTRLFEEQGSLPQPHEIITESKIKSYLLEQVKEIIPQDDIEPLLEDLEFIARQLEAAELLKTELLEKIDSLETQAGNEANNTGGKYLRKLDELRDALAEVANNISLFSEKRETIQNEIKNIGAMYRKKLFFKQEGNSSTRLEEPVAKTYFHQNESSIVGLKQYENFGSAARKYDDIANGMVPDTLRSLRSNCSKDIRYIVEKPGSVLLLANTEAEKPLDEPLTFSNKFEDSHRFEGFPPL